jgi:superfamily II DNA/RNA helicase
MKYTFLQVGTGTGINSAIVTNHFPLQQGVRGMKSAPGIHVLVLAPTRELATQIQEEAEKFGRGAGYASAVAYGE